MAKTRKILKPVHPNVGIQADYRARLEKLIDEMSRSYLYFLRAQYRETPPLAQDATPARELERELSRLGKRWKKNLDDAAPKLGRWFAQRAGRRSEDSLRKILRDGGLSVEFRMTREMRDVVDATIQENVALIRSIGEQYHSQIEQMVMRSVTTGRDLKGLTAELRSRYDITRRRAALIARDQNNKATSTFVRVRQRELGLKAKWLHSHGGKEPRKTHLANSGNVYDPAKGWFDPDPKVRRRIWPGELINCRCVSVSVVEGFS